MVKTDWAEYFKTINKEHIDFTLYGCNNIKGKRKMKIAKFMEIVNRRLDQYWFCRDFALSQMEGVK